MMKRWRGGTIATVYWDGAISMTQCYIVPSLVCYCDIGIASSQALLPDIHAHIYLCNYVIVKENRMIEACTRKFKNKYIYMHASYTSILSKV